MHRQMGRLAVVVAIDCDQTLAGVMACHEKENHFDVPIKKE